MTGREINKTIAPSVKEYRERTQEVEAILREVKDRMFIEIVTPDVYFYKDNYCRVTVDTTPLYRDDNHLSTFGSEYISKAFDKVFYVLSASLP
jgi:hypothetical protein